MKYIYKIQFILVVATFFLASCQQEELVSAETGSQALEIVTSTQHSTRTSLGEDGCSVVWSEGDAIAVYDFATTKHKFVANISDGVTRFQGKITPKYSQFVAAYPYDLTAENDLSQKIVMTLPIEQTAVAGSFGSNLNLSIAKGERNVDGSPSRVNFRNVCQLFKLTIPSYASNRIAKIEFATTKAIAGQLVVDYSGDSPVVATDADGSHKITLLPPNQTSAFAEGTYYMVVAPEKVEGFTLSLTDVDGKVYTQQSSSAVGGDRGIICSLGNIDLIEKPTVTVNHAYSEGLLVGTDLSLTAPVPDKEWSATIKNANGDVVRTLASAIGTLASNHDDTQWPYLPKGNYTVEYTYTTANEKLMQATQSFQITENPEFGLTQTAASTYSYYSGDGVERNLEKANTMDASTVTAISTIVTGISQEIMNNDNYTLSIANDFNGTQTGMENGVMTYQDCQYTTYGAYTLRSSCTFDGVTKHASKSIHITGIPYQAIPPTQADWTGGAHNWEYNRYDDPGVRIHDNQINKAFSVPANVNVNVTQDVDVHTCTVGTTYSLSAGGAIIFTVTESGKAAGNTCHDHRGTYPGTFTKNNATVSCRNTYGNAWSSNLFHGTHALVRKIIVNYR